MTSLECERFRRATVEDGPLDPARLRHAEQCAECAEFLRSERELAHAVDDWRRASPSAPDRLRAAVIEHAREASGTSARGSRVWRVAATLAAAAALLVAVMAGLGAPNPFRTAVVSQRGGLLVDEALAQARAAERSHAQAIARLTTAARPVLARADDSTIPPAEAARLRALANRLAALDDAIEDVRGFLETNPGHPGARTMLLAAYIDKTELLGEILAERPTEDV